MDSVIVKPEEHLPVAPASSGAPLLLLTLAVLAGSICRPQGICARGQAEDTSGVYPETAFSIQLLFGEQRSPIYGAQTSNEQKFLLRKGERVTAAGTNDGIRVCSLHLVTSKGCKATLGTERDYFPLRVSRGSGKHAPTIEGKYLSGTCITALNFKWGHSPEDSISGKPEGPIVSLCGAKETGGDSDEGESNDRENAHDSSDKDSDNNGGGSKKANSEDSKGACRDGSVDKGN